MTEPALTFERLRELVAELLAVPPAELGEAEDLRDRGLDSVRLMTLAVRLRAAGAPAGYADLGERPALDAWWALLCGGAR